MSVRYYEGTPFEMPEKCPYCGRNGLSEVTRKGPHIAIKCSNCGGWTFAKQCNEKNWKEIVKRRAQYKCERCGKAVSGRGAQAHHKIPVWFMPELQFDPDNGICLCTECHKQIHGANGTIKEDTNETD